MRKSSVMTHARRCSAVRGLRHIQTPKTTQGTIKSKTKRIAKRAGIERGIDRALTDTNANDRQHTRHGEHRHQSGDGEQILSFARQHDRRVSSRWTASGPNTGRRMRLEAGA
jgi:hypothetical protein